MSLDIYSVLKSLNIPYAEYTHSAVYTLGESDKTAHVPGIHGKNLFLRNRKGDQHYLVITSGAEAVNLKMLAALLGENGVGFASPERLLKYLKVTPGSVSPFALINDEAKEVFVLVDTKLLKVEKLGFHPNINTSTLLISPSDFVRFLESTGHSVRYVDLNS